MSNPTHDTYTALQDAYAAFNVALFNGELPPCLITLQRHKKAYGYFAGDRFGRSADDKTDEIALNPNHFGVRPTRTTLSTLVHEMVHLWQHRFGKPSRNGYHNKQWAAKMHEVGLIPTSTGAPGGKETGQKVTHMIREDGPYALAFADLYGDTPPRLYADLWGDDEGKKAKSKSNRVKFVCPDCDAAAWGKPSLRIMCMDDDAWMAPVDEDAGTDD